jgi:hypothetical protein
MLNEEQARWLISKQTLEEMSHMSLRERAKVVCERLQLTKFTHETLRRYYIR